MDTLRAVKLGLAVGGPRLAPRRAVLVGLLLATLAAWGLRAAVVLAHRLHPDEALYAGYGLLIASGRDVWLTTVSVRKPPLLPYLMAASLGLIGRSELAVRLPGLAAGTVSVGLAGRLACRLYRSSLAGLTAATVMALSPVAILLSDTGRTDPLMVVLGLAACVAAAEGRAGWSGLLAGLSVAAKQTGVAWLPLVGLLTVITAVRHPAVRVGGAGAGGVGRSTARLALGFLAVVGAVLAWDRLRVALGAEGFWQAGVTAYGGLRLAWPTELDVRLHGWLGWMGYLVGSPLFGLLLVGGAAVLLRRGVRRRDWAALLDVVLVVFCVAYLFIHWLWAFPVWSRYLLLIAPVLAILAGRVVSALLLWVSARASPSTRRWVTGLAVVALLLLLLPPAASAIAGEVPIGPGLPTYDGVEQVASFLQELPEGSVLYHRWLGWHYSFYLFDGPLYLAYWPTPAWLAQDVLAFGDAEPRYIVFPIGESSARVEAALGHVGYRLDPVLMVRRNGRELLFTVFHITPREG